MSYNFAIDYFNWSIRECLILFVRILPNLQYKEFLQSDLWEINVTWMNFAVKLFYKILEFLILWEILSRIFIYQIVFRQWHEE